MDLPLFRVAFPGLRHYRNTIHQPFGEELLLSSISSILKRIRWYHWALAALVLVYIVYVALAYLYLPGKLKQVAETDVAALLGRNISVEKIAFNPFVLSLDIEKLSVADRPGRPLVGWQRLFVNFSFWKSLFKREIALGEFSIDRPEINIEKQMGRMNFSDILDRVAADTAPEAPGTAEPKKKTRMALEIDHTAINQGLFNYTDLSGTVPASSNLNDITIEVRDLYLATGDEHLNPFDLRAEIPGGGNVHLSGQYRIDPLNVDAEISAEAVQLSTFSAFGENILPVKIENGLLYFSTRLLVKQENGFQFQADRGHFEITSLDLADNVPDPPMFHADSIMVDRAALNLSQKSFSVEKVTLDGLFANQWIDPEGKIRYETLLTDTSGEKTVEDAPAPKTGDPWKVIIGRTVLQNSTFTFSDRNEATAQTHSLSEISLSLENFTLIPDESALLSLSALLDKTGKINAEGTFITSPFALALDYRLEDIGLSGFSKYVEAATWLRIDNGSLFAAGSASIDTAKESSLTTTLDLSLTGFRTVDYRTGDVLLNLNAFDLENIAVDTGTRSIAIASTTLTAPEIFTRMSPEKQINLAVLSKPGRGDTPPPATGGQTGTEAPAWQFYTRSTRIHGGIVHYTDQSVAPAFTTAIQNLTLEVGPVATDSSDATTFSLTADIDRYAPLSVKGTLLPLDRQPGFTFTTILKGLEMPGLSPYSVAFIGNKLKSGTLSLALDYSIKDRKLKGKNNIVAKNLYLGEKVPSETAVDAPVKLGLALLRDLDGVIDLDVGISGDLDDPSFSLSGIIGKALLNIIVKTAASPFKLLGALVGSEEELGEIEFAPGLATLTPQNEARLEQLSGALAKRPQLALAVRGNASKEEDGAAIKARKLLEQAAAKRGITPGDLLAEAGKNNWWETPENRDVLTSLNNALALKTVSDRNQQVRTENPELTGEALTTKVFRQVYADLEAAQTTDAAALLSLADARALSIKQQLVNILGFDDQRVSLTKTRGNDLSGRTIKLEIDAS